MPHIEVLVTDGRIQKRILWLDIKSNGVYAGFCMNDTNFHTSYHADGHVFQTDGNRTQKIGDYAPLKDLKGLFQLGDFGFVGDLNLMMVPPYQMKKLDAIVYIDVRPYVERRKELARASKL
jgi:hypothetical protein